MKTRLVVYGAHIGVAVSAVILLCVPGRAIEFPQYDTSVQVTLRDRTGVFLNGGKNFAGQNSVVDRFEQFLLIDGKKQFYRDMSATIKLRGFVDNVFDVQGDNHWSNNPKAIHNLSNSFALAYDDVLREAYIDYNLGEMPDSYGKLFARLGKQQVVWGKADGFRLLDIINPFDFREPFYPTFEDVRIPLWMIRVDYTLPRDVLENAGLEIVATPFYQQDTFPPAVVSPWSFRAFDQFQAVADALPFRILPNLFDKSIDPPVTWENWEAGARWSHTIRNFSYTLNYYYDWTNLPHAKPVLTPVSPQDPLGFRYDVTPDRVHRIGSSFDYNIYKVPVLDLENVVIRGELLGSIEDRFYGRVLPTGKADYKRDTFQYVLGIDRYVYGIPFISPTSNTQTLLSGQVFQTFLASNPRRDQLGTPGGALLNDAKTSATFYALNTSMQSRLSSELLVFYSDAGEWWFRPRWIYDVSDKIKAEIGGQFFIGHANDLVGAFARRGMQEIFIDVQYQLL